MDYLVYLSFGDQGWGDELLKGLAITLGLALCALPVGMIVGTGVAALSVSYKPVNRWFATTYTTVLRGLPELLTLFIIYHGVGLLINKTLKWIDPSNGFFELNPFGAGVIALGLVFSSYAAEVLRGAWKAIDKGQREAGYSLSMNRWLIFWHIERPQLLRLALPGLGNECILMLKGGAVASVITVMDLMGQTRRAFSQSFDISTYFLAAVMYLVITTSFVIVWRYAERYLYRHQIQRTPRYKRQRLNNLHLYLLLIIYRGSASGE